MSLIRVPYIASLLVAVATSMSAQWTPPAAPIILKPDDQMNVPHLENVARYLKINFHTDAPFFSWSVTESSGSALFDLTLHDTGNKVVIKVASKALLTGCDQGQPKPFLNATETFYLQGGPNEQLVKKAVEDGLKPLRQCIEENVASVRPMTVERPQRSGNSIVINVPAQFFGGRLLEARFHDGSQQGLKPILNQVPTSATTVCDVLSPPLPNIWDLLNAWRNDDKVLVMIPQRIQLETQPPSRTAQQSAQGQ